MFDVFLFSYLFFPFLGLRLSIGEDVEMLDFCLTREKNLLKWMKKYVTSMVQLET